EEATDMGKHFIGQRRRNPRSNWARTAQNWVAMEAASDAAVNEASSSSSSVTSPTGMAFTDAINAIRQNRETLSLLKNKLTCSVPSRYRTAQHLFDYYSINKIGKKIENWKT
ncbi:hypothetical protein TorRG33x02_244720, partial [Trema orientale]